MYKNVSQDVLLLRINGHCFITKLVNIEPFNASQ
jgi:hypothetical protein